MSKLSLINFSILDNFEPALIIDNGELLWDSLPYVIKGFLKAVPDPEIAVVGRLENIPGHVDDEAARCLGFARRRCFYWFRDVLGLPDQASELVIR